MACYFMNCSKDGSSSGLSFVVYSIKGRISTISRGSYPFFRWTLSFSLQRRRFRFNNLIHSSSYSIYPPKFQSGSFVGSSIISWVCPFESCGTALSVGGHLPALERVMPNQYLSWAFCFGQPDWSAPSEVLFASCSVVMLTSATLAWIVCLVMTDGSQYIRLIHKRLLIMSGVSICSLFERLGVPGGGLLGSNYKPSPKASFLIETYSTVHFPLTFFIQYSTASAPSRAMSRTWHCRLR